MKQVSIFETAEIDSGVGKLIKGEAKASQDSDLYLEYPRVQDLLEQAQQILSANKKLFFKTSRAVRNSNIGSQYFLGHESTYSPQSQDLFSGTCTTHFGAILNQTVGGQSVLGNFSLAYVEAKASQIYHQHFHGDQSIDHFYFAEGISNLNIFADVLKAYDIKKNDLAILLIPNNAIKASRRSKYSGWQTVEHQTQAASLSTGRVYQYDKVGSLQAEIKLHENTVTNLDSPIYKVKLGERWVIVVPYATDYQTLNSDIVLELSQATIEHIKNNTKIDNNAESNLKSDILNASLGQAVRVIFNLLGSDYELIPEAIFNLEGGSWSSIAIEKSSSGRHYGTNSMHEVIYNGWHKVDDVAIPWNYLGFDRLTEQNKYLLEDDNVYLIGLEKAEFGTDVKPEKLLFIECPQHWKKIQKELLHYVTKFVYREYTVIGSNKYLLSNKELMLIAAKYLANLSINNFDKECDSYKAKLAELKIPTDLAEFLELIAYTHLFTASKGDFYSAKTHPASSRRLSWLAHIEKLLPKFAPASAPNFRNKIQEILSRDKKSEFTTLWDIYRSELNKIK